MYTRSMSEDEKTVAKMLVIDQDDNYLMICRSNHPEFGDDPDIPGGTQEEDETELETAVRETYEEAGISVNQTYTQEVFSSVDYSDNGTKYVLFSVKLDQRPEINLSWEHASYDWLSKDEFAKKSLTANDRYMHMVGDVVASSLNV